MLSVCSHSDRDSSRVLGPFTPSHRPHLHSFFLGAGGLRLAALAVQSLLRQAATADAPLPLESLSEHSPHPYDLPISQKSGHTLQFAPLPPTPANTRSRAWQSQAREARPPACTCTRRALRGIDASSRPAVCRASCVLCFALSMVMSPCRHAYAIYIRFPLEKYRSKYNINTHVLGRSVELLSVGRRELASAPLPPPSVASRLGPAGLLPPLLPRPLRSRHRFGAEPRVPKAVQDG